MAAIIIAGLPSSRKTPGVFLNSILGGPGAGSGTAQQRLMLVGNMIESAPSLTAPAATLAAGTATLAVPVQIFNESDAILYFGKGSELHLMVQAALKQDPNTVLWATPLGKGATPTAASMTVTFSGTAPTTDLAIEVLCDGQRLEFAIPSGTTTTGCATLLAQNVLNASDLPITAQFAAGVCTFTAK